MPRWKGQKGFEKDKKRRTQWGRPWTKWLKYFGNRKHRQLEREKIETGKTEDLHSRTKKDASNPWDWD